MSKLLLALLIGASVSGCATAPNQASFAQAVINGLRLGARASAGAMSPDVYAEQHGLAPPRRMKPQQTHCQPDYNGGFNCVTREQ